jgi:DNA-directed RNA polymerase specialized sigma24 family protein
MADRSKFGKLAGRALRWEDGNMNTCTASPNEYERYEVFRRAIVQRDSAAWADVAQWYRPLMISWARQRLASVPLEDSCADIADEAFARAWSALASTGADTFPSLATMLGYLRRCVASVTADRLRAQSDRFCALTEHEPARQLSPEQEVLVEFNRTEVWALISTHITSSQEEIVVRESLILGLPPRTILERHPDLFEDVAEVYRIKRNLFERLRRDDDLRELYGE